MASTRFSLEELMKKYKKSRDDKKCKEYITKYFYPTDTGEHCVLIDGKFKMYTTTDLKTVYLNKFPKELSKFYLKEYLKLYKVISDIDKPKVGDDYINVAGRFKHSKKTQKRHVSCSYHSSWRS